MEKKCLDPGNRCANDGKDDAMNEKDTSDIREVPGGYQIGPPTSFTGDHAAKPTFTGKHTPLWRTEEELNELLRQSREKNPPMNEKIKFSDRAAVALQLALQEAIRFDSSEIRPEHILIGLMKSGANVAGLIEKSGLTLRHVREFAEQGKPEPDIANVIRINLRDAQSDGSVLKFMTPGKEWWPPIWPEELKNKERIDG